MHCNSGRRLHRYRAQPTEPERYSWATPADRAAWQARSTERSYNYVGSLHNSYLHVAHLFRALNRIGSSSPNIGWNPGAASSRLIYAPLFFLLEYAVL